MSEEVIGPTSGCVAAASEEDEDGQGGQAGRHEAERRSVSQCVDEDLGCHGRTARRTIRVHQTRPTETRSSPRRTETVATGEPR